MSWKTLVTGLIAGLCALVLRAQQAPAQPFTAVADTTRNLREALARGQQALDANDLDAARRFLEPVANSTESSLAAQAWALLGEISERQLRFHEALAAYRTSVARDPGGRYAARALARVEYLQARSEGDFVPLTILERVRSDPKRISDPAAIAELVRAARAFPPGWVRSEALLLAGQAYASRLDRPHEAGEVLHELATDSGASRDMRRLALQLLAQVRERTGEIDRALNEQRQLGGDPNTIARLQRLLRRRVLYRVALSTIVSVLFVGIATSVRALRAGRGRDLRRAWFRPLPLAHIAMLSVGGGLLARTHDDPGTNHFPPFLGLGVGALLVYLSATAWSLMGSSRHLARVGRALACALAMLAVSFLAMHRFDPGMLDGIGL